MILTHGMPVNGKCKPEMLLMQGYLAEGGINTLSFDLRNTEIAMLWMTLFLSVKRSTGCIRCI